jgi:hypothetical protein
LKASLEVKPLRARQSERCLGVEKLAGAVRQAVVGHLGGAIDADAVEVSENRGGTSAIKGLVMAEKRANGCAEGKEAGAQVARPGVR